MPWMSMNQWKRKYLRKPKKARAAPASPAGAEGLPRPEEPQNVRAAGSRNNLDARK